MHPMIMLLIAIVFEVIGSAALKLSVGFTKLVPSIIVLAGYGISFYLSAIAFKASRLGPLMPSGPV